MFFKFGFRNHGMDSDPVPDWIQLRQQPGSGFESSLDPDLDSAKCLDPDRKYFVLTADKFLTVVSDTIKTKLHPLNSTIVSN